MATTLLIASLITSLVAGFATWRRDRIKDGNNVQVRNAIRFSAVLSLIVVALAGANQYHSAKQAATLRVAQLRLSVLQGLSSYRIEMLDNYWVLVMNSVVTTNYASLQAARKSSLGAAAAVEGLEARMSDSWREELKDAKAAFERLQKISREVLIHSATYPGMVPDSLVKWAETTLALQFTDVPKVANAYRVTAEAQQYASLLGLAIGSMTGEAAGAAEKITQ